MFVLVILILLVIITALKPPIAISFTKSGDKKLRDEKFVEATVEYKKADFLIDSVEIDAKLKKVNEAQKDILVIEDLIREKNDIERLDLLNQAKSVPINEYESVLIVKKMLEADEPMFALIVANTALEMNRNYKDAWLYHAIAHLETTQKVKLTSENRNFHNTKAKEAFEKAKLLDPNDELIDKYLNQLR